MKHVLGFSGGIDSQACAAWLMDRYSADDVILLNTQAGRNEHPITVEFVARYSTTVHPVIVITPLVCDLLNRGTKPGSTRDRRQEFSDQDELTFDRLAYVNGIFPSRKAQFCTYHLKLEPQKRWSDQNLLTNGMDYIRYTGVRADESIDRSKLPEQEWDDYFDVQLFRPLLNWSKKQCFDFVTQHGQTYNPLYKMGFGRVGCAPCINANKEDIYNWSVRFPAMINKVRDWEVSVKRTFFAPMVPGLKINWVDEVVAWSKTLHGGKRISLPFLEADVETKVCVSKYGLCE
jgi:3'-phosphoadenosine 5'-phosphosulfate sulfotransferase (PAPS reductase)/FAD synthetase